MALAENFIGEVHFWQFHCNLIRVLKKAAAHAKILLVLKYVFIQADTFQKSDKSFENFFFYQLVNFSNMLDSFWHALLPQALDQLC